MIIIIVDIMMMTMMKGSNMGCMDMLVINERKEFLGPKSRSE